MGSCRVGIVGFGYWGPNFARVVNGHEQSELVAICEIDKSKHESIRQKFPKVAVTESADTFLEQGLDAVIISSSTSSHYNWLEKCIEQNVHILCEKPLTATYSEAEYIYNLSHGFSKTLMVGHVFEYHSVVQFMNDRIVSGLSGDVLYIQCQRSGLGPVRKDVDVNMDLATHDVSILLKLLNKRVNWVQACGSSFISTLNNDISFITIEFEGGIKAQINVSWIDPVKQRSIKVVCSKEMLLFEDVNTHDKLKIYTTGTDYQTQSGDFGKFQLAIRDGDVIIPNIKLFEPLAEEYNHFMHCVETGQSPVTDIQNAMRVMRVLDAIKQSSSSDGSKIKLH